MSAMTTAAIIRCPELPSSGLAQSMHDPTKPLSHEDIISSPAVTGDDEGLGTSISRGLIADAVKRLHPESLNKIFPKGEGYRSLPSIKVIPTAKTSFWQFGAIHEDEGTTEGHYGVHNNIFLRQLGLTASKDDSDTDDFSSRLWLVHGDQLTARRIRSVKSEQYRAERQYDRRNWMLGISAWFHTQMNLLYTIVRTHWSPVEPDQSTRHCLKTDITAWHRSCTSRDNLKYHQLEPVVLHSFTSRVCALFYAAMRRRGYLDTLECNDAMDIVSARIETLTPGQFYDVVEDVRMAAFIPEAWSDGTDIEYRNMCRMLQEIEAFLTIRHAIKQGDVGILRYMVDPLILFFFGAGQSNYGHEMLFYRWNLSPANTPELQHAILASGLVNWTGLPNSNKPIDLSLEHLNGNAKIEMKCYKNSTHDMDIVFNRVCLSNTWTRLLREKFEGTFGEDQTGKHTVASARLDIFFLARNLFVDGLAERRTIAQEVHTGDAKCFDSEDIRLKGMMVLSAKVDAFNQQNIRHVETPMAPLEVSVDDTGGFVDTGAYVKDNEREGEFVDIDSLDN